MNRIVPRTYLVGGAVRDQLLGLSPKERDWVVTHSSPEEMVRQGFQPVGKDFPVFIHPRSGEEYALARTERKSGRGYQGFTFFTGAEVTLEEDLQRRDLTINAIAQSEEGELIDPYGGRLDLERRLLRHVSPAFVEDPLRVLRVARFAAKFHPQGFRLANETLALMREIALSGELRDLKPERVWQESLKALNTENPQVFFVVLRQCAALAEVYPEIDALFGVPQPATYHPEIDSGIHTLMALEQVAKLSRDPVCRFAALVHDLGKARTPSQYWPQHRGHEGLGVPLVEGLCQRLGTARPFARLGKLVAQWHLHSHRALQLKPSTLLKLFDALDVWRRPETLEDFLVCCEADARGRTGLELKSYPPAAYLRGAFAQVTRVGAADFVAANLSGKALGAAIATRRLEKLETYRAECGYR